MKMILLILVTILLIPTQCLAAKKYPTYNVVRSNQEMDWYLKRGFVCKFTTYPSRFSDDFGDLAGSGYICYRPEKQECPPSTSGNHYQSNFR